MPSTNENLVLNYCIVSRTEIIEDSNQRGAQTTTSYKSSSEIEDNKEDEIASYEH